MRLNAARWHLVSVDRVKASIAGAIAVGTALLRELRLPDLADTEAK
jgi:hypothetical protein